MKYKSFDKYGEIFQKNISLNEEEFNDLKLVSDKLSLENGKILLDLEAVRKKIKILKSDIEFQSKNINFEWRFTNEIEKLKENEIKIGNLENRHLKDLDSKLNDLLSKISINFY